MSKAGTNPNSCWSLVNNCNGIATQVFSIAQKRTDWQKEPSEGWKRGTAVVVVQHSLPSYWERLCDGMLQLLAKCARRDGRCPNDIRKKRFWKSIDGRFIPFGASVELSVWKHMLKEISFGCVLRAGRRESWSGDSKLADCRDLQELDAAEIYVKRFKSQEMSVTMLYSCLCANWTVKALDSHRPLSSAVGDFEVEDCGASETFVKMRGFQQEILGLWRDTSFTVIMMNFELGVRARLEDMLSAIEVHRGGETIEDEHWQCLGKRDQWHLEDVGFCEEWTGTTRFQILRTRFLGGCKWVEGQTHKDLEVYPTGQHLARSLCKNIQETNGKRKLQNGQKSVPNCK